MAPLTAEVGGPERRGRPKKISPKALKSIERARKFLQKKSEGAKEVTMAKIFRRARVRAHPSRPVPGARWPHGPVRPVVAGRKLFTCKASWRTEGFQQTFEPQY